MKKNLEKESDVQLPDWAVEFGDNSLFKTYLSWVRWFYDTYMKPTLGYWESQNRLREFYGELWYFNDSILIPETNEVLFQLDSEARVIAFILFGKRFPDDSCISLLCIATHSDYQNEGRAKSLLQDVTLRIKELGFTKIRPWEPISQPWDTSSIRKWSQSIERILQNSWLDIIE